MARGAANMSIHHVKPDEPSRIRDTVYVIGAGFSQGLGYPLTKSLLIDAWDQLPDESRDQLRKIIEFHHPEFSPDRLTSFPDIEQLLTEVAVNLQMFDASRPAEGRFTKEQLIESREILLFTIDSLAVKNRGAAASREGRRRIVQLGLDPRSPLV